MSTAPQPLCNTTAPILTRFSAVAMPSESATRYQGVQHEQTRKRLMISIPTVLSCSALRTGLFEEVATGFIHADPYRVWKTNETSRNPAGVPIWSHARSQPGVAFGDQLLRIVQSNARRTPSPRFQSSSASGGPPHTRLCNAARSLRSTWADESSWHAPRSTDF
jgi:hypothetical protein